MTVPLLEANEVKWRQTKTPLVQLKAMGLNVVRMVCVAAACFSAGASITLSQVLEPLVTPEAIFSAFPGGLLMLGDSITRSLFKRITCILDDLDETDCAERGSDYKNQRCEHGTCHWFANRTDGFILEFDWLLSFGGRESPQTLQNGRDLHKVTNNHPVTQTIMAMWKLQQQIFMQKLKMQQPIPHCSS